MDDTAPERDEIRLRYGDAAHGIARSLRAVYDTDEDPELGSDITRLMLILSHVPKHGH